MEIQDPDETPVEVSPEPPTPSSELACDKPWQFQKGNQIGKGVVRRSPLMAQVRKFLGQVDPEAEGEQSRLTRILLTLVEIATDKNNRNAVKAAELLITRGHGEAAPSEEAVDAMKAGGATIQVLIVPQVGASPKVLQPLKPSFDDDGYQLPSEEE